MASGPNPASSTESDSNTISLQELSRQLQQVIYDVHEALNQRQLDQNCYPWTMPTPNFKCEAAYTLKYTTSIEGYLQDVGGLFMRNPALRYEVEDISSHITRNASRAELFIKHLTSGWPMGIVRRSVGIAEFRLLDDVWRLVSFKQAPGYGQI